MTGWQTERLGKLLRLTSGQSPSGFKFGSAGTPYYKVDQLGRSDKYLTRASTPYFSTALPTVSASSVVIAKRGAAIALNRVRLLTEPSFMDTNVMALTPTGTGLEPEYLYYWLSHRGLWDIADVTSVPQINNKHILPLEIPLPPLAEQQRIVSMLRDADALAEGVAASIAKKQAIKQGIAQELLTGRTRLPGFSDEWQDRSLGELGRCIRGVAYDPGADLSDADRPTTVRLLRANNIQNSAVALDDLQFVHVRCVASPQLLTRGDIVICMANGSRALVGKAAYFDLPDTTYRYTFGAFMGAFRAQNGAAEPRYVAQLLLGGDFRGWLDVVLAGSSINNLRPRDVEDFVAPMPDKAEQAAIADVLADADAEIDLLKLRLVKAKAIKQGMAQRLLTGRTRLPVPQAVA